MVAALFVLDFSAMATALSWYDLLKALEEHPEWRAELRRLVLSEELLELPAVVRELRDQLSRVLEAIARTQEQLQALTARVAEDREGLRQLRAMVETTQAQIQELRAAQAQDRELIMQLRAAQAEDREQLAKLQAMVETTQAQIQELRAAQAQDRELVMQLRAAQAEDREQLAKLQAMVETTQAQIQELRAAQAQDRELIMQLRATGAEDRERLAKLSALVETTQAEIRELRAAQAETQRHLDQLSADVARLTGYTDQLRGWQLEYRHREYTQAYFGKLLRGIRVFSRETLAELLDEQERAGTLEPAEVDEILAADVVFSGRRAGRPDGRVYALAEVSWVVDEDDVERAARRAALLAKALHAEVLPVVAGETIREQARRRAAELGVYLLCRGVLAAPAASSAV